jgi:hypothetical protein
MTARDDAPARPPLSAEELEDIASTARELVRVWGSFQPMSPHHNTLRLLAEHAALKADLAEAQRSLADTSTRYLALTERVITVADEATGPHPVIDADEALTLIERAFFDGRVQHAALTAALATRDAELAHLRNVAANRAWLGDAATNASNARVALERELAACWRELAEALRSSCEDERIEEHAAQHPAPSEREAPTHFYKGEPAESVPGYAIVWCGEARPSRYTSDLTKITCHDCAEAYHQERFAGRTREQLAAAQSAPSEREAPALHNVREAADVNPDGSKWPQTPERIAASIVKGWLSDGAIGSRLDELEQSIANVIQGDRDATKRVLDACGLAAPQPAEATGAEPAWWSEVDAEAQARIASGELAINAEATGAELPSNPKCGVCKRAWNADPGTVYCAAQHGTCGMCGTPRATHDCLTESVVDAKPASAPPTAEPRSAGVTHEEALRRVRGMVVGRAESDEPRLRAYIAQQAERDRAHAELERRARELCEAEYALRKLGRQRYGGTPVDNGAMNDAKALRTAAIDALAELLGERS